jgi:hypothetical protein
MLPELALERQNWFQTAQAPVLRNLRKKELELQKHHQRLLQSLQ